MRIDVSVLRGDESPVKVSRTGGPGVSQTGGEALVGECTVDSLSERRGVARVGHDSIDAVANDFRSPAAA